MVNFTLLAGGATSFIATYLFNSDAGSLTLVRENPTGPNPVWITTHPTNKSVLYALNELDQGGLQSYTIGKGGVVSGPISSVSSGGSIPAHVQALSTGEVSVMNYVSATGRIVPTVPGDPAVFKDTAPILTFQSNPHETLELAPGHLLVPDLGADKIWQLARAENGSFGITGAITQPAGSGPRHIAVLGNLLYTLHETSSTLTTQNLLAKNSSVVLSQISTIPANASSNATWGAAEVLIPPKSKRFPTTFIYCSNRNNSPDPADLDPAGDTIAIFSVDAKGQLKLVNEIWTGILQPRGLAFSGETRAASINGAGDAEFLAVGGQGGVGGVAIFKRTEGGRNLVEVAREKTVPTRTSFVWI